MVSAWRIWLVWCVPRFARLLRIGALGVLDPQALLRSSLLSPDQYPDLDTEIWPLLGAVGLAHCWKHTVALYQIHGSLCTSNTRWLLSLKANQTRKLFEKPRLPVYYFRPSNCIGVTVWAPTVDTRALPTLLIHINNMVLISIAVTPSCSLSGHLHSHLAERVALQLPSRLLIQPT